MQTKKLFLTLFFIVSGLCVFAEVEDSNALLSAVDSLISFADTDLSAEYTLVNRKPGGATSTTVAAMFRRDAKDQFVILILEPAIDKGKGYLKTGENLWLYDPADSSFTFTSAKDRFQSMCIRNSDFNRPNYSGNYSVLSAEKETLGKFECTVLKLEATNNSIAYPISKIWVSSDNLIRKIEDYSLSGQLMRSTAIPSYQKLDERWLPQTMVIQDNLVYKIVNNKKEYERTTVTIKNPSLQKLPDTIYTKEYLQRMR